MTRLTTIGFDADDTLWHNEKFYRIKEDTFAELLKEHAEADHLITQLTATKIRNLKLYGFGIKGSLLSMIETAMAVSGGKVDTGTLGKVIEAGRAMMDHPVELFPGVREALESLHGDFRLIMITKGDRHEQERKFQLSGLAPLFHTIEIVTDKTEQTYERAFADHGDGAGTAVMVGNSLKSDVIPALAAGAYGIHIPFDMTWAFEHAEAPLGHPRFHVIESIQNVPDFVRRL